MKKRNDFENIAQNIPSSEDSEPDISKNRDLYTRPKSKKIKTSRTNVREYSEEDSEESDVRRRRFSVDSDESNPRQVRKQKSTTRLPLKDDFGDDQMRRSNATYNNIKNQLSRFNSSKSLVKAKTSRKNLPTFDESRDDLNSDISDINLERVSGK
jgi:hypothetical protein